MYCVKFTLDKKYENQSLFSFNDYDIDGKFGQELTEECVKLVCCYHWKTIFKLEMFLRKRIQEKIQQSSMSSQRLAEAGIL